MTEIITKSKGHVIVNGVPFSLSDGRVVSFPSTADWSEHSSKSEMLASLTQEQREAAIIDLKP